MNQRNREALLLVGALVVGGIAFLLVRANLDVRDNASRIEFALTCLMAGVAHLAVRRFAPLADPVLLPTATMLNMLGLVMIHRLDIATATRATRQGLPIPEPTFATQTAWTMLGVTLAVAVFVLLHDHRVLQRYTYTSMALGLALLLMPLLPVIGASINGARLWVRIGMHSFQPGEFAKLCLAIFFAGFLVLKRDSLALIRVRVARLGWPRPRDLGPILVAWALSVAILVFERDLGMSLLFFGMFITVLYMATGQRTWLAMGALLFAAGSVAAWLLFPHVQSRVAIWLDPWAYADTQGYQVVQALYGLATGGLFGTGLGDGFPYLVPFAKSDFILTSLGEELGFVGLTAILMMYAVLVQRGLRIALRVRDPFGQLLAAGLATVLGLQTFIVAGGVTRLVPLTGLTTPFLSAGGSSLVANWMVVGLLIRMSDSATRARLEA